MSGKDLFNAMIGLRRKASQEFLPVILFEVDQITHDEVAEYVTYGEAKRTGAKMTNILGVPLFVVDAPGFRLMCEGRVLE